MGVPNPGVICCHHFSLTFKDFKRDVALLYCSKMTHNKVTWTHSSSDQRKAKHKAVHIYPVYSRHATNIPGLKQTTLWCNITKHFFNTQSMISSIWTILIVLFDKNKMTSIKCMPCIFICGLEICLTYKVMLQKRSRVLTLSISVT